MQFFRQLYALTKRNVTVRYKHSLLGFIWGFIKPLLYLFIFIIIFSAQFTSISNYVLYTTSGLIFWFFFANMTSQGAYSIIASSGIIKSLKLQTILFPLAEGLSELFNLCLTLFVFLLLMPWFGFHWNMSIIWLFPTIILFALFSMGITLILSSLNVYFRDVGILWSTIQPAFFYLTPIAYTESLIPEKFIPFIRANPMYAFMQLIRQVLYENRHPDLQVLLTCSFLSIGSFMVGYFIFHRLKNQFITAI